MPEVDLRKPEYLRFLAFAGRSLGLNLSDGPYRYGWGGKSIGTATDIGTWLRLTVREGTTINERTWTGEETASVITGVSKPALLRSLRWQDGDLVWRADELELVTDEPLSAEPDASSAMRIPSDAWWQALVVSLEHLRSVKTTRINTRQDLITRRIAAFSDGAVDPTVSTWTTAHGDLHWANLIGPSLVILDWEGWGLGPAGLDAATLWAFSVAAPALRSEAERQFKDVFATRDGMLSQLFMAVELMRMTEQYGDHPKLLEPLRAAATHLRDELAA